MSTKNSIIKIVKRDGRVEQFDPTKVSDAIFSAAKQEHGEDRSRADELSQEVMNVLYTTFNDTLPNVEDVQDVIEHTLKRNGHIRTAEAYMVYRAGRASVRAGYITEHHFTPDGVPRNKAETAQRWSEAHNCDTVEKLNEWVRGGKFKELIDMSIAEYENDVTRAADMILKRPDVRVVIVAGPSSSGKTTTVCKLEERLKKYGKELTTLNVDNYFQNLEEYEVDDYGDRDFEKPEALRLDMINRHLADLLAGKTVKIPFYDFKSGTRHDDHTEFSVSENQIILLDSLHGLYPPMTAAIADEQKFKLYIEPITILKGEDGKYTRWTDVRLLRRMLRDRVHRNHTVDETLGHWHYVRNSELKYIIPYINTVDCIINGGLPFELPVLKKCMAGDFPNPKEFENDPNRMDAYVRALRVRSLLDQIDEIDDMDVVPKDSHLREFIGGSSYGVH